MVCGPCDPFQASLLTHHVPVVPKLSVPVASLLDQTGFVHIIPPPASVGGGAESWPVPESCGGGEPESCGGGEPESCGGGEPESCEVPESAGPLSRGTPASAALQLSSVTKTWSR